jgi:hypothetical protein
MRHLQQLRLSYCLLTNPSGLSYLPVMKGLTRLELGLVQQQGAWRERGLSPEAMEQLCKLSQVGAGYCHFRRPYQGLFTDVGDAHHLLAKLRMVKGKDCISQFADWPHQVGGRKEPPGLHGQKPSTILSRSKLRYSILTPIKLFKDVRNAPQLLANCAECTYFMHSNRIPTPYMRP